MNELALFAGAGELAPDVALEELRQEKQVGGPVNCSDSELCTFLLALEAGFLPTYYSDTNQSVQLKSMSIASRSYRKGKKTVYFHGFQSLTMYKNSTEDRGADLLTWFRGASLARTSALPAEAQALRAHAAECGATWRGSLAKFDPASSTWRTAQPSLLGDSEECSVTWPRSGMTAGGLCWELPTLAPPTSATGSGLWAPTPICNDAEKRGDFDPIRSWGLAGFAKLWPTPTASLGTKGGRVTPRKSREGGTLIEAVSSRTFATPTARDWRSGKASQATHDRNSRPLSEQIGGLLSPTWVEWLMGWPIGWTDLRRSAMGKCPDAQPQPGEC